MVFNQLTHLPVQKHRRRYLTPCADIGPHKRWILLWLIELGNCLYFSQIGFSPSSDLTHLQLKICRLIELIGRRDEKRGRILVKTRLPWLFSSWFVFAARLMMKKSFLILFFLIWLISGLEMVHWRVAMHHFGGCYITGMFGVTSSCSKRLLGSWIHFAMIIFFGAFVSHDIRGFNHFRYIFLWKRTRNSHISWFLLN